MRTLIDYCTIKPVVWTQQTLTQKHHQEDASSYYRCYEYITSNISLAFFCVGEFSDKVVLLYSVMTLNAKAFAMEEGCVEFRAQRYLNARCILAP